MQKVNELQFISMVGYFLMTYIGTILLLVHHAKRIGTLKFWTLVISPLIIFVYNYPILFKYILPNAPDLIWHPPELIPSIIVYTLSIALLGLVIGIGFYTVARSIQQNKLLQSSLIIAAIGFLFYFNSADATVLHVPYPPYGLANVGFVGVASFLVFTGLYNAAVSVSRDINLRNMIKKSVSQDSKFLSSMGNAQLRHELERNIIDITSSSSVKPDNLYPSLSAEEARKYVNEVLEEITRSKQK